MDKSNYIGEKWEATTFKSTGEGKDLDRKLWTIENT